MKENSRDESMQRKVEAPSLEDAVVVPDVIHHGRGFPDDGSRSNRFKAIGMRAESVRDNHTLGQAVVCSQGISQDALSTVKVSVLVLTKNGMPDIDRCLKAVYSQQGVGSIEVIVVDSGSTDETLEVVKGFQARIEQIQPRSFHHSRTRNFAAGLASGEILVFLSQDAIPSSDRWLEAMVANFSDPDVGAVY